ncbi:iron transport regulator protein/ sensor kinase [Gluconacetobacter johannae DSM 13595]|uniref:DUF4880 domain-containing protein n=1 Tax=Gluconacetobacter johannae TaxID=112140 RepID=A0A7W4J563_9PROT|nr:DUF4880 domain-containing protein [Gluconacetobacter johannae]MBB2174647.1 DUF4880 domain-containing protein [Gluconacetobacter johannae]GBQ82681.1 iron transport regulator protein/ sensor kinase [Gluconacetobacter johannae DSM 13595]
MKYRPNTSNVQERAAEWIARLHADDCTDGDRDRFLRWLHSDQRHATVFEHLTDLWDMGGGVVLPHAAVARPKERAHRFTRRHALACLGAGGLLLTPLSRYAHAKRVLETGAGGLRSVTLAGRTRCQLDTNTRLVLSDGRPAALEKGQIVLSTEIAAHVSARNVDLRLRVHTTADIRVDPGCTDVTVIRGRVFLHDPRLPRDGTWINAGQRLRIFRNGKMDVDNPDLDELLSWRSGRLIFRNRCLRDVIAEINRYASRQIVLAAPALAERRLSGVYYVAQGDSFLQMLPRLLPVRLVSRTEGFEIVPM